MYKIYTLSDPITNCIRWVGQTKQTLKRRLMLHKSKTEKNIVENPAKMRWILSLSDARLLPKIELLDETNCPKEALMLETYWTYQFKQWGFDLLNLFIGKSMPLSTRQKMSDLKRGKPVSAATLAAANERRKKSVVQLTIGGDYINRWDYIIQASRTLAIDRSDITRSCKTGTKKAGGFRWMYESEYLSYIKSKQ